MDGAVRGRRRVGGSKQEVCDRRPNPPFRVEGASGDWKCNIKAKCLQSGRFLLPKCENLTICAFKSMNRSNKPPKPQK
jgi:hypothetical protein